MQSVRSVSVRPDRRQFAAYAAVAFVGIMIAAAGIVFHQSLLNVLPLFVSLFISYLQSKVSRYAPLLGSFNSLLYALVYFHYGLYASAAYAVLFSFPVQLITFIRWQKNRWRGTTVFRRLSAKQRIGVAALFVLAWGAVYAVLRILGSDFAFLDNTVSLLGILTTFLMMFACIEYTVLMIPSSFVSIVLYSLMIAENPEQVTYLIYAVYCFICQCIAFRSARLVYREQTAGAGDFPGKSV